jgi:hypothetical protein
LLLASAVAAAPLPPNTEEVAMVLCAPGVDCELRKLAIEAAMQPMPTLDLVVALSDTVEAWTYAVERLAEIDGRLVRAREALAARDLSTAAAALDEAATLLHETPDDVPQKSLFDLYFLRGTVLLANGDPGAAAWFDRAAAVAGSQPPRLPASGEAVVAFARAQDRVRRGRSSRVSLQTPAPGGNWAVDGISADVAALSTTLPAGAHRVTAHVPGRALTWSAALDTSERARVSLTVDFSPEMPAQDVSAAVQSFAAGGDPSARAGRALADWCHPREVHRVVLVVAGPQGDTRLTFDPGLFQFGR